MVYPGNTELSSEAQERVMTAFRQVVTKLQDGQREEALIGLEFALRLDPSFAPAVNLQRQLASGAAEIDLSEIIGQLHAPTTDMINELLVEAVDDFNQRNFLDAKEKVERVLLELPGHQDARQLLVQVQDALKVETQVGQFLAQAREALDRGDPQEAANFVMMAQALDPHHRGISATLQEIHATSGGALADTARPEAPPVEDFDVSFEPVDDDLVQLGPEDLARPPAPPPTHAAPARPVAPRPGPKESTFGAAASPGPPQFDDEPGSRGDLFDPSATHFDAGEAGAVSGYDDSWEAESLGDFSFGAETKVPASEGDDISDLFAGEGVDWSDGSDPIAGPPSEGDDSERIRQLLAQGAIAFDRGDDQGAIDIWSRIYLLDPSHEEANQRIEAARQRKEEVDRKVEHILYEAQDAALADDAPKALALVDQILELSPGHLEAVQLRESLASAAAAAPDPLKAPPALDEDLFSDLAVEETAPAAPSRAAPSAPTAPTSRRRSLPLIPATLGVGALVVILVGVYFGGKILGGRTADEATAQLNRSMAQGETLFAQGRVEEAVHLYQGLLDNFPTSDLDRQRIERRLGQFQQAMSPPAPTPVAESLAAAEELLAQGRLLSAYGRVRLGIQSQPQDPQLLATRDRILRLQPLIGPLYAAAQRGDFQTAVAVADELLGRDPDLQEVATERARYLFNAAVVEMRTYNLTGAEVYLSRLNRLRPEDEEAARVLRFTEKYKTRPADLQLNTFIKSLTFR